MLTYVLRRLLQMIPVFLGATFLIFAMVYAIGDPIAGRCGERPCPAGYVARLTAEYHLDQPLPVQYFHYLANLVQGNLGHTFNGLDVAGELARRWPTTLKLTLLALVFELIIGVAAGVLAALRRGRFLDHLVTLSTLLLISIPVFVLGSVAQLVFGVQLKWFPVTAGQGTWDQLILPGFVLATASIAYVARLMRASLIETMNADFIRTAKAKGLSMRRVVLRHGMRNSLIPVLTYIGTDVGALMGGAVVTERIFNINGIGGYLFQSINTKQGVAVVGTVTALVLVYLIANLVVDVLYGLLDPRISRD